MNRWPKSAIINRAFERLQLVQIGRIRIEVFCLDSTSDKVHPEGAGALSKNGPQAIGKSRGGWTTRAYAGNETRQFVL
jgi:hypothetical protein